MRSTLVRVLFAMTLTLLPAPAAFASYYWIGFGVGAGVQKRPAVMNGVKGTLYSVDAYVGSDETQQNAKAHTFVLYVTGSGPAGGCPSPLFNSVVKKVQPPVALARFQIFYPDPKPRFDGLPTLRLKDVDYKLSARTTGDFLTTYETTLKFPPGGTISCQRLP